MVLPYVLKPNVCAGTLLALSTLALGCSSSSSPSPAAGSPDASTGSDATGGADATGGGDAPSPADAAATDDVPPIDAGAIVAARPYSMHAPTGYDPTKPTPLVVMFHGAGVTGDVEEASCS